MKKDQLSEIICENGVIFKTKRDNDKKTSLKCDRCDCPLKGEKTVKDCGNNENRSSLDNKNSCVLSLRDIWEHLYRCRDLELNALWTRSIFLWTLIALALSGYGLFLTSDSCCIKPTSPNGRIVGILFGFCVYILGILDFFIAKGSKFWYEVYENKINFIEKHCLNGSIPLVLRNKIDDNELSLIPNKTCWCELGACRYSPSRINVFIGLLVAFIGFCIALAHSIYLCYGYTPMDILNKILSCRFYYSIICPVIIVLLLHILIFIFLHCKLKSK